jgi:hypothetical protein
MAVSWLKKGKAAHEAVEKADAQTAQKQAAGSVRRFYLPKEKETQITFMDGALDDDGLLETMTYWEHQLNMNGSWRNWYACTQDQEPCPICQGGDIPSLVAVFTVLDHSKWSDKNGLGHQHEKRLFVCKRETFKRLQKIATKRGGLDGASFDVSRIGEKSAAVGSDFDFIEKRAASEIMKAYGLKAEDVTPYDYEEILNYRDAAELRQLGFGTLPIGAADTPAASTSTDYDKDL